MHIQEKNIFENINLTTFISNISQAIKAAVEKYWEQEVQVVFLAVNDFRELRQEHLVKNIDFFSSQIKVENHKPVIIRLSKDFIKNTLDITLEEKTAGFKLTDLTPLEIRILNNFCEFIYKKADPALIPQNEVKLSEKSEKNFNIVFLICIKNNICSKIMLSIPQDRINLDEIKKSTSFRDEDFLTSNTYVRIKAGSSKITLDELKNLSQDDIVLLEKSDSSHLTLISGEFKKKFKVKVNPALILKLNDEDEENREISNEVAMEKNLWDDIQIEINAEFEKVKMTIGELKQITQGQIVDLGSVFDNEISLFVEDKKVAVGELIIINDRYAVKLNEILATGNVAKETKNDAQTQGAKPDIKAQSQPRPEPKQAQPPKAQSRPRVQQETEEEEFDYSDFEK